MKDNLEDLLNDILDDVEIDQVQETKTETDIFEDSSLEDLLGDVLSEIEADVPVETEEVEPVQNVETEPEQSEEIIPTAMSEVVVDLEAPLELEEEEVTITEPEPVIVEEPEPTIVEEVAPVTIQATERVEQSNDKPEAEVTESTTVADKPQEPETNNSKKKVKTKKVKTEKVKTEKVKTPKEPKKKKKGNKLLLSFIVLLLISAIGIGSWFAWDTFFNFKTVNVFERVNLVYSGSNGYASVDFEITDPSGEVDESVEELLKLIEIDFDKKDELSNEDKITLTINENEELTEFLKKNKLKIEPLSSELVVSHLKDASEFDLFKDTIIELSGFSGHATATLTNKDFASYTADEIMVLKKINYKVDKGENLSNDDVITITAEVSDEIKNELNIMNLVVENTSMQFTVESLIVSPESIDEIPGNAALRDEALAKATLDYGKQSQTYANFKVEYSCFTAEPKNEENYTDYFEAHPYTGSSLMYIISIENKTGTVGTQYFSDNYGFTNIQVKDGIVDREQLKLMSPFQDFATTSEVKAQLELNGFTCTP